MMERKEEEVSEDVHLMDADKREYEIEVGPDVRKLTLKMADERREDEVTLRQVLPAIRAPILLRVENASGNTSFDRCEMKFPSGDSALDALDSSYIIGGNEVLGSKPVIMVEEASPTITNGSLCMRGESRILIRVKLNKGKVCA